jgi:peptide-methionine (S)-S-oxide reductase
MKKVLLGLLGIAAAGAAVSGSVYDFSAETLSGEPQSLSKYKGQVLLIVNTASKCGFTKQYAGLQTLYEKYKDRGLVVLGFPANNFGRQEPGTNEEIMQFCTLKFNVTFPMFGKISVKGSEIHPLYTWLTKHPNGEKVSWNFNKFLIGRDGDLIEHFGSRTAPESEKLTAAIETALNLKGKGTMEKATFAAGCFWGVESAFRTVDGVIDAQSGYMGGTTENPAYKEVCSGRTGHAEAVEITFDPSVISYRELVELFWRVHNPTQVDRQGPDVGTQYRSSIFFQTPEQKTVAEKSKAALGATGKYKTPIATEIVPAATFYRAEEYHQRYFEKTGRPACHFFK